MSQERSPQKTIPMAGHGTREARNRPDAPPISMRTVSSLAIKMPGKNFPTNGNFEVKRVRTNGETVSKLVPLVRKPLTRLFSNKDGGNSGGGTSKEALGRAKQKARKSRK